MESGERRELPTVGSRAEKHFGVFCFRPQNAPFCTYMRMLKVRQQCFMSQWGQCQIWGANAPCVSGESNLRICGRLIYTVSVWDEK